ncbi:MAG TPA: transketolase [Chitinophagales bacterium]|nr:transketolase [Chitinophagales bacterium]
MDSSKHKELLTKAFNIKKRFLGMYKAANAGHVGCSLSVAEMITFVRFGWMAGQDEIILSKGHAAAALYSMLAEDGSLTEDDISTFYKNNTYLAAHPPVNKIKRVPFATGSLGHGLSLAAGLGLAQKLKKTDKKVFCLTSDGEINEGTTWEAALFIAHHKLTNVIWLVDRNNLQGYGRTEDVMKLEPLDKKLEAFGFNVVIADGHNFSSFEEAKQKTLNSKLPTAIICNTTKGKGWKTYEDKVDCHYLPMKDDQYELVTTEIKRDFESRLNTL